MMPIEAASAPSKVLQAEDSLLRTGPGSYRETGSWNKRESSTTPRLSGLFTERVSLLMLNSIVQASMSSPRTVCVRTALDDDRDGYDFAGVGSHLTQVLPCIEPSKEDACRQPWESAVDRYKQQTLRHRRVQDDADERQGTSKYRDVGAIP